MAILRKKILRSLIKIAVASLLLIIAITLSSNLANIVFPPEDNIQIKIDKGEIKRGASLYSTLTKEYSVPQAVKLGRSLGRIYDTRKIKAGDNYKIYHSTFGKILKFEYSPDPLELYVIKSSGTDFIPYKTAPDFEIKKVAVKGDIDSSLYRAMSSAGVEGGTIMDYATIFQWQVDFLTEVRPGDKFLLVFEQYFVDDEPVKSGSVIMAGYKGKVGNYTAIRFKDGDHVDFYNADGDSLRKQFLKAPLNYRRISSKFNPRRRHPILKYVRPHLAIDYAAPRGTPISSVASGKVIYKGWKGGYGRTVIVKHNSIYTTQYGHMNSYGNVWVGKYVKQNDIVGYVGSSGLSTGPHLDFKIKKYGKPVNYLRLKFPPSKSVSKENMDEFKKRVEDVREYLKIMESDYFVDVPRPLEDVNKKG